MSNLTTTFTNGSILIRPFLPEDVDALYEAVRESLPELTVWMAWCSESYSIEDTRAFIASREDDKGSEAEYSFAIVDAKTNTLLGSVAINQINRTYNFANLGYWVRSSSAGRGIASSAARLAARFALEELGVQRVEILAATANLASQRAAEKAGARREGILRKRLVRNGEPQDAVMFSLVIEDFR